MRRLPLVLGAALLCLLAGISVLGRINSQQIPLPVHGPGPAFQLTDSAGKPFDSASLAGKVWVINFFFARCSGPCPIMNGQVARLAQIYQINPRVQFISLTVDPENDSPAVLREYASKFGAERLHWTFLTGPKNTIVSLVNEGFRVGLPDDVSLHSTRLVLLDAQGQIRGYYLGTDPKQVQRLINDIAELL